MPRFPLRRVLLYQSLKMIENKGPPTGKPLSQKESLASKHASSLQDAGVTTRRPWDLTASQAVCRLTQVRRGRGAKRGELRGAARARAGRGGAPGVSVLSTLDRHPPRGGACGRTKVLVGVG